jgi:hypothetical protein
VRLTAGRNKGAGFGYTKVLGYHPILATRADSGEVLHARMRKGAANTQRGARRFIDELVARVRRAGASGEITVRVDSGFWSNDTITTLNRLDVRYTMAVRTNTTGTGRRRVTRRLIVRRTRLTDPAQQRLWPHWRHHAFLTCATRRHQPGGMKGPTFGLSQQPAEAESSPILGGTGSGGSSSDNDGTVWHCQTGRARQARRRGVRVQEPVVEPPQERGRLEPGGCGPDSSARPSRWATPTVGREGRRGGHGECLRRNRGEAAGEELGADPVERLVVNVGTATRSPSRSVSQADRGKACRRLTAWWRDGGSVVVRGRESRLHGEGTQRDRRRGPGTSGGRR